MNLLFIGYWPFHEGLTQATILPHLEVLANIPQIDRIVFTSIERNGIHVPHVFSNPKLLHIPLRTQNIPTNILNKFNDFIRFPRQLKDICANYHIDQIICRGAPAGALGYLVYRKTGIPFSVESFEPHAEYMRESGVWRKFDPRYIFQKKLEERQKELAKHLMPVSMNYAEKLSQEGVAREKISLIPCEVDMEKFRFSLEKRDSVRRKLGLDSDTVIGIYVGKFGDIYYDDEAFRLFFRALGYFGEKFFLIILSPQDKGMIHRKLSASDILLRQTFVGSVSHQEIPDYLSAADFAFSVIKPTPHRNYCSPIKNGEYWACGLPILVPDGIGDDSEILKETGLGVVMSDLNNTQLYFTEIEKLIMENKRNEIRELAVKYRNPEISQRVYEKLFGNLKP